MAKDDWLYNKVQRVPPITDAQIAEMRHIEPILRLPDSCMYRRMKGADKLHPRDVSFLTVAAEFERLQSKATAGPWHSIPSKLRDSFTARINQVLSQEGTPIVNWSGFDDSDVPYKQHKANAELIAASRSTTLPSIVRELVQELERLRGEK